MEGADMCGKCLGRNWIKLLLLAAYLGGVLLTVYTVHASDSGDTFR